MSSSRLIGRGGGHVKAGAHAAVVAALDIGSTKITCAIAEHLPQASGTPDAMRPGLRIVGVGQILARGVSAGSLANIDEAERCIRLAVDAAERMAERTIGHVHVNVSGGRPESISARARVRTQSGTVSPRDTDAVVSAAIAKMQLGARHVLHLAPIGFALDGVASHKPPLGMHGDLLDVELGIVTVHPSHLKNLKLVIERAHLAATGFSMSPYAAARGVLMADEMTLGTIVIDMGGATTSFAVFKTGNLAGAGFIGLGGSTVTNDIAHGLSTTIAHAERMKTMFGSVLSLGHDARNMLAVPLLGERGVDSVHQVPKQLLVDIIRPRMEEILDHVGRELAAIPAAQAASRIVLTGGASQLQGVRELATEMFGCQVRLGQPHAIQGLPDSIKGPGFAVASGLLACAARPENRYAMPAEALSHLERSHTGYVRRVGRWLAESL